MIKKTTQTRQIEEEYTTKVEAFCDFCDATETTFWDDGVCFSSKIGRDFYEISLNRPYHYGEGEKITKVHVCPNCWPKFEHLFKGVD